MQISEQCVDGRAVTCEKHVNAFGRQQNGAFKVQRQTALGQRSFERSKVGKLDKLVARDINDHYQAPGSDSPRVLWLSQRLSAADNRLNLV